MYLHIGDQVVVSSEDIIAILEYDYEKFQTDTIQFLRMSEEDGFVECLDKDATKIKSLIIAEINKKSKVFLSTISITTLKKRLE